MTFLAFLNCLRSLVVFADHIAFRGIDRHALVVMEYCVGVLLAGLPVTSLYFATVVRVNDLQHRRKACNIFLNRRGYNERRKFIELSKIWGRESATISGTALEVRKRLGVGL